MASALCRKFECWHRWWYVLLLSEATNIRIHEPLTRYVKLRVAHAPRMPATFSPLPRVSDPDMSHGTCVTHVPWCMPGSLTSGFLYVGGGQNIPGIPGTSATNNLTYLVRGPCVNLSGNWRNVYLSCLKVFSLNPVCVLGGYTFYLSTSYA